jgi:hypothetical protein
MIVRLMILLLLVIFIVYNLYSYVVSIKIYNSSNNVKRDDTIDVEYEEVD